MVYAGEVIENPLSGERITFLEVPGEVNGDLLRFDWTMPPRFYIPEHIHVHQEERHEIISGTLRGRVAGRERDYMEGERVTGPAGVPHAWHNPDEHAELRNNPDEHAELRIVSELQPALGFEALLETYFAIGRDLRTCKKRIPGHVLRLAMLVDESKDEFYPTGMPMAVWKASLAPFSALARGGRMLGYEARYQEEPARDRSKAVWSKEVGVIAAGLAGLAILALLRRRGKRRMRYGW